MNRRQLIKQSLLGAGALALGQAVQATEMAVAEEKRIDGQPYMHSACRWCYRDIPMEEFCERALDIFLDSIELLPPAEWPILRKHNLACAVGTADFISITDGFNDKKNHRSLQKEYLPLIRQAADTGIPNIICFSGNRRGMDDEKGLEMCARGLEPVVKAAEEAGINVIMELLNSKVDHRDYMCDHTDWGVALVNKLGSPNFKLLYDIYHMQIMEGNIVNTIRQYSDFIGHYHTGGVPGRHEINSTQEIYYPVIVKAIAESGYQGYIGQEFIPTYEDKITALEEGVWICSVFEEDEVIEDR
ncbi:MAG: TIM barrel protein [Bacteroidota bacterium]